MKNFLFYLSISICLSSCITTSRIGKWVDKNPDKAAAVCAIKFPVKLTGKGVEKLISSDTTKTPAIRKTVNCDSLEEYKRRYGTALGLLNTSSVPIDCPPSEKIVLHDLRVDSFENTAKIITAQLQTKQVQAQLNVATGKLAEVNKNSILYAFKHDTLKFIGLLAIVATIGHFAFKLILKFL